MNLDELNGLDLKVTLECLELLDRQPDDALLKEYYRFQRLRDERKSPLTVQQRKWVETNLQSNVQWQRKYEQIVEQSSQRRLRLYGCSAVAATIIFLVPLLLHAVVSSTSTIDKQITELLDIPDEVVRGSATPPPTTQSDTSFEPTPSLQDVRDLLHTMPDSTKITQSMRALRAHYERSVDRFSRADIARRLSILSALADDLRASEHWRAMCEKERAIDCAK